MLTRSPQVRSDLEPARRPGGLLPAPGTAGFDELVKQYRAAGLPMVGVGSWGPVAPQTQPPSPEAPSVDQLDRDLKRLATGHWGWVAIHQPVSGFAGTMTAEARRKQARRRLWENQLGAWDVGHSFAACMWASHGRHIQLQTDAEIVSSLELRDGEDGLPLVSPAVERGDALWSALGAWPWSAFPDGHPPARWWTDELALHALLAAMAAQAEEMAGRLRQACYLIGALTPS
jgi:hypothetical protein